MKEYWWRGWWRLCMSVWKRERMRGRKAHHLSSEDSSSFKDIPLLPNLSKAHVITPYPFFFMVLLWLFWHFTSTMPILKFFFTVSVSVYLSAQSNNPLSQSCVKTLKSTKACSQLEARHCCYIDLSKKSELFAWGPSMYLVSYVDYASGYLPALGRIK